MNYLINDIFLKVALLSVHKLVWGLPRRSQSSDFELISNVTKFTVHQIFSFGTFCLQAKHITLLTISIYFFQQHNLSPYPNQLPPPGVPSPGMQMHNSPYMNQSLHHGMSPNPTISSPGLLQPPQHPSVSPRPNSTGK